MEANYKIRPATLADQETIYHFICHLEEISFERESFMDRFKHNLGRQENIYLVATNEVEEPIGFISAQGQSVLHQEGRIFEIQELYVARNWRGLGIGKLLIESLQEKLHKTKAGGLEVSTHAKRTEVRRFFSKMGFTANHIKLLKQI